MAKDDSINPALNLQMAREAAERVGQHHDPLTRSLQQGWEHGWYHGTVGDIGKFDPATRGEATGAASAKKGYFFARDPSTPPAHMLAHDPESVALLQKLGKPIPPNPTMQGHGAHTASSYAGTGGSREYKEAMRMAHAAEKVGNWDAYEKFMMKAEDAVTNEMNYRQGLVAKHGDARDEMLEKINNAWYGAQNADKFKNMSQADYEAHDKLHKELMPYGWYTSYEKPHFENLINQINSVTGEKHAKQAIDAIKKYQAVQAERKASEVESGANVMPVALRYKNPMYHDFQGNTYRDETYSDLMDKAMRGGHDALILKNTFDPGGSMGQPKMVDVGIVFHPSQIRGKFAAFDPTRTKESDLLAARGGLIHKAQGGNVEHFKKGGEKKALPLQLPRAQALTTQQMQEIVDRIARQQAGEHVTSGEPGDTKNLAGRSMAEAKRVQGLQYGLTPTGTVTPGAGYQMRKGDINVGLPGDTTISNQILEHINGLPIGSEQQGGPRYGHGHLHKDEPFFWASGQVPAQNFQNKVDELARMTGQEPRVIAHHLAMGRVANNFAQHLADANIKAILNSSPSQQSLEMLNKAIAGGFLRKNKKTGEKEHITFPEFAGVPFGPEALEQMKNNPELRKWFNNRMKTSNLTKPLGLPSGLDTEWAVTEPALRNLEVSMTGHSVGQMMPGKPLIPGAEHETYSHGIQGRALGAAPELAPVEVAFPDATQYIRQHYRPADFTGTIQKVYPHQIVDEQHLQEMAKYYDMLRKTRGFADGGDVKEPSIDEMQAALAMKKPVHLAIGGQGPKNWMKGVEGVINPLKGPESPRYTHINDEGQAVGENYGRPMTEQELQAESADPMYARNKTLNKWVESNLGNYIRKQMATHDDPVRKLAEEGILHVDPNQIGINRWKAEHHRANWSAPKLGKSEEAQAWEDATDVAMRPHYVSHLKEEQREPWMDKVDPSTKVFAPTDSMHAHYLGFDHLVDILKQDLAEGRMRPDQLNKVSMEQAVRRAHEYNEERKRKMAETALKATEGMPVHKDYGNGFRWLELALDKNLPEGWSQHPSGTYTDPQGVNHVQHPNYSKLEEALKYEGDTMGHCVGGYCPDVASGDTRIFSLRDKKNEPHVTVETQPRKVRTWDDVTAAVGPTEASKLWKEFDAVGGNNTSNTEHAFDTFVKQKGIKAPDRIEQIKGKGNAKPASKYIPYAQDFVKSGNWTNVEDLHHVDMVPIGDNKYLEQSEAKKHYEPRIKMAIEFLQNHPAFKEQHAAKAKKDKDLLNLDYEDQHKLEKIYGQPLHPKSSYSAPDLLKAIKNPQDYVRHLNEHYPSLNYWLSEAEKGMAHHGYEPPVQQKARGGIVYKATGGSMPSLSQMQAELMMKQPTSLSNITNVGAEEAPNLPTKDFILPHGQHPGQLPVGGIDMQPAVPGQQLWPTQPPGQQPQQGQQQPQQGGQPPQGGPAPQGGPQGAPQPSNILQMTPQGRALGAMQPQQPAAMARGGSVPSKYEVKPYHDDEGKRVGWSVHEGDYIHDVYPTKAYATNVMKQWIEHDKKKNEPQQAKKGGTIKPVGRGITKEKVTISPNLDAMQYELMSVKHFKKAK